MDIDFIRPLLNAITFPRMDLFDGFDLDRSELTSWFKNPSNRYRVFTEEYLDGLEGMTYGKKEDNLEGEIDILQPFQSCQDAISLIWLSRTLEKQTELVYENPVFDTLEPRQLEYIKVLLDLNAQSALQLGLDFGRVESYINALKYIFENHTVLTKKFTEKELVAMSSSAVGSRKNLEPRTKAIRWIEKTLDLNPDISINALAKKLHNKSAKKLDGFERIIPLSTAKDWIRKVKNERQAG